jgi:preprotein translocase subunit SecB
MAEGNGSLAETNTAPQLSVLVQYIKDLSFENPHAPQSLGAQEKAPNISIQVNVNARHLAEADYEVSLILEGSAGDSAQTLFKFELTYCGIFRIQNIPAENLPPVILIECPRLLFPFARQIIADSVRNGGFPPLFIDPIDFQALFVQRAAAEAGGQATA